MPPVHYWGLYSRNVKSHITMDPRVEMIDLLEELIPKDPILMQTIIQTLVWDISENKFNMLKNFMNDYCAADD
jgi:hypothetical protein